MAKQTLPSKDKKILLTGVFGPFGVDDDFGRKENIMELFHNQVTKGQGIASFRFHHRSFGLYFLAENIDADTTILDFPSRQRFIKEIKKQSYDVIGISFIAPNMVKAKEMIRLIRLYSPQSEVVVGGHGAAIEGVKKLLGCDHVAKGEGIRWMRRFLGQDVHAPVVHPILTSAEKEMIFGVPVPGTASSILVPGVGCVNGCKFCSTSHYFGKQYTSFFDSGDELFTAACTIADARGSNEFFVMDENFLKSKERAFRMIELMEQHQRYFRFHIFSSAETIVEFGVENLARLGVNFLWLGVESSTEEGNYEKNRGIDPNKLIDELQSYGMMVLASGILCAEHHTPNNIQEEIDFLVRLRADFVQFMLLIPLPVTALYQEHKAKGWLRDDLPFEEWHGQKELAYKHPDFGPGEAEFWINKAFRQEYEDNGSSMLRVLETSLRGYLTLKAKSLGDPHLTARCEQLRKRVQDYAPMTAAIVRYAVNEEEKQRALEVDRILKEEFGSLTLKQRLFRTAILGFAHYWNLRTRIKGDMIQPKTIVTHYRAGERRSTVVKHLRPKATELPAQSRPFSKAALVPTK